MDISGSQCTSSSGCESGWTMYLDQSSFSKNQFHHFNGKLEEDHEDEDYEGEEEDLSMVSDASSGPPHCSSSEDYNVKNVKNHKTKKKPTKNQQHQFSSYLDDTASSHHHVLTKKVGMNNEGSMENNISQGFSATHFKAKSSLKNHFGFFKSEKPASKEPGGFQGRKWK